MNDYFWSLEGQQHLAHFGIRGMKWGIRRFQNSDGTYTSLGKKRRNSGASVHEDYTNAHSKKSVKSMSTKELQERNKRLQAEKQYEQLTKKESKGRKFIAGAVGAAAMGIAVSRLTKYGNSAVDAGEAFIRNLVA